MSAQSWAATVAQLATLLGQLPLRDDKAREMAPDEGFRRWTEEAHDLRERSGTIYLIGNGASASMASHLAADLAKHAHLHTEVFSDLSLITAISNDIGYERVFAEPLSRRARRGDMLVAVSSSGRSPNVLNAVEVARQRELAVVTLSAFSPDNPLRACGDVNAHVAAGEYGYAESCDAAILHRWMDLVQVREDEARPTG